jgi:hypothetical protein
MRTSDVLSWLLQRHARGRRLADLSKGWHSSAVYVHQGKAEIDRQAVAADEAVYRHGSATITGAGGGVRAFRWELGTSAGKVPGNVESVLRMTRECWMLDVQDGDEWQFPLDSIVHNPPDPADCHTHPGPGIRALLSGEFVIRQTSENGGGTYPGDPWWETGTEAVISTPLGETPVHFLHGMLLPITFKGRPDTAKWLRAKPKKSAWKLYVDQVIKLWPAPPQHVSTRAGPLVCKQPPETRHRASQRYLVPNKAGAGSKRISPSPNSG